MICLAGIIVATALSVEDIIRGLEDVEAASQSYSVDVSFIADKSTVTASTPVIATDSSYLEDGSGRLRLERTEERLLTHADGSQVTGRIVSITAYNGSVLKQMEGRNRFEFGRVSADLGELSWGGRPRNYLAHFNDEPVSVAIRRRRGEIVGASDDGVVTVETPPVRAKSNGIAYRYRFLIDANFSVIEKSMLLLVERTGEWYAYARTAGSDYRQTDAGVYVPSVVVKESYSLEDMLAGREDKPILRQRFKFTLSNWNLSPPIDDSMFELTLDPDVLVTDVIQGRTYRVTTPLSDATVSQHILRAEEFKDNYNSTKSWRLWLVLINILAILIVLACLIARRFSER